MYESVRNRGRETMKNGTTTLGHSIFNVLERECVCVCVQIRVLACVVLL